MHAVRGGAERFLAAASRRMRISPSVTRSRSRSKAKSAGGNA